MNCAIPRVLIVTCVLFAGVARAADEGIPADALTMLRDATVLIKVADGAGGRTGSGFFLDSQDGQGYVITNAHVAAPADAPNKAPRITVVLGPGTNDERELPASIACASASNDLAILSIAAPKLPAALPLADSASLRETLPVCILGFPFGKELALDKRHPAVTVSNATVSSLRRDLENKLSLIQLDGNLNPGNSGGPVVDRQGRLIGVAVARIENAGIGFAIPAQALSSLLTGEISELVIENAAAGEQGLRIQCNLLDPHNKIASVAVQVSRFKSRAGAPSEKWQTLDRKGQVVTGSVSVGRIKAPIRHYVTVEFTRTDGTKVRKPPHTIYLEDGKLQGEPRQVASLFLPSKSAPAIKSAATGAVTATPINFGGDVSCIAPAPDGSGLFVLQQQDGRPKVFFWNRAKNVMEQEIGVPRSPSHLALVGERVVVACPESKVVAIIDPASKKIVSAVEIQLDGNLAPAEVGYSSGADLAYVLCTRDGEKAKDDTSIVEIDIKAAKYKLLTHANAERVAATETHLLLQDNFGGSPTGLLNVLPLAELAPVPGRRRGSLPRRHESYGPVFPTRKGLLVASSENDKTKAFTPDAKETPWTVDGVLLAPWPDASAFLLATGGRTENTNMWPLKAVDATGAVLWEHRVGLDKPVSLWITQAIHFNNSKDFLIIGTAGQGTSLAFALRNVPLGVSRTCLLSSKSEDVVIFAVSRYSGEIYGRSAFKVKEESKKWYYAKLPQRASAQSGPPDTLFVGDILEFQPKLPPGSGEYSLKGGPPGMTLDPKTSKIVWKTDASSLGRYDVEVMRTNDGVVASILKFSVHVKSRPPQ